MGFEVRPGNELRSGGWDSREREYVYLDRSAEERAWAILRNRPVEPAPQEEAPDEPSD